MVAELYRRAIRAADEDELYEIIAAAMPELVTADRASIALLTDDGDELEVLGLEGNGGAIPLGQRIPVDSTGPGEAITSRATHHWQVDDHPDRFEAAGMRQAGLTTVINAPLEVAGDAVGALNVARSEPPFDGREAQLMNELAGLLSVNLERFQMVARVRGQLAQLTQHQRRLEVLGRLGRQLSTAVNEDQAFLILAELIADLLPVDRLSLALIDHRTDSFRIVGLSQEGRVPLGLAAGDDIPLAGSGVGQVVSDGEPRYFADIGSSPAREHGKLADAGFRSGLSMPIRSEGRVVAVLNTASVELDAYTAEDRAATEAVATIVGEALDRIKIQAALAIRDQQLAAIVDESPLLMMTIEADGTIDQLSQFGASQLGHRAADLRGQPLSVLYPDDQRSLVAERLAAVASHPPGDVVTWEAQMLSADGERLWIRHSGRRMGTDDTSSHIILVCQDVTALLELADRLEHEATHDSLTGLVNRREFDRALDTAIAEAGTRAAGSVCYIDVDQFKIVNDTAGHRAGDALLVQLAELLRSLLQPDDIVARLGGDEFAVFLPHCSMSNALRVAERLRTAAADLIFCWENRTFGVSLSIGVAVANPDRPDTDDVMGRADDACYRAKYNGRNQVSISGSGEGAGPTRPDGEWGSRLRDALRGDELVLLAQPIVPIGSDDDRARFELLIHLQDDELLPASVFIPPAERLGIVSEIDSWTVLQAVSLLCDRREQLGEVDFVAVNLSPRSIESDEFLEFLVDALARPDLDPRHLLFEITETAALSQFSKAVRFIETVATVGSRFALDDFGAGFSTFHYLKRLPVDVLKIDGSLIEDLDSDPIDCSIVRAIVEVANTLGMKTVAEYVETGAVVEQLSALGVDYAQGRGVGRPEPLVPPLA